MIRLAAALLASLLLASPHAARALDVPALTGHVNDYARVLPEERARALEAKLTAYEQRTGQQFALLTVQSLEGDSIEGFSIRVADKWQLGDKKRDDGLILVIVPNERKLRVEVGYGLEGNIPDAIAARVIREIIAPAFQRGDYAGGIDAAFDALMRAASGQGLPEAAPREEPRRVRQGSPLALLGPLIFFLLLWMIGGGGGRRRRGGMFWLGPLISAGMGGGGGFGGGRRGGGGGGGFRGGGGGFGGGGASGGW